VPLFAVIGVDGPSDALNRRNARLADHRAYLKANDGRLLLVGPLRDDNGSSCGSLYVFEAESATVIQEWLSREPFFESGVYGTLLIGRFDPVMCRMSLRTWTGGGGSSEPK
jgi:uncharacterized protein YciI